MEDEFINGIQDAEIWFHQNNQSITRGSKVLATISRAICTENGLHGLNVDSSGHQLNIKSGNFPDNIFIVRATLSGADYILRNVSKNEEEVIFSSSFEPEAIKAFCRKLGRHLRFIDTGYEPIS